TKNATITTDGSTIPSSDRSRMGMAINGDAKLRTAVTARHPVYLFVPVHDIKPVQLPHPAVVVANILQCLEIITRIHDPQRPLAAGHEAATIHFVGCNDVVFVELVDIEFDDVI